VAVVDTAGRPTSWLTTGAIFLELYAPSTHVFSDWMGGNGIAATGDDWREYLDTLLAPSGPMARLDSVVCAVNHAVVPLGQPYRIAVMIPYPDTKIDTINYGGRTFGLRRPSDAAALGTAYVTDVNNQFQARHFGCLKLDAIYWLHEAIQGPDTAVVPAIARVVHAAHLRFLWVPYFQAPGSNLWRRFGFDEVWMQPNFFFSTGVPTSRIDSAFAVSRRLGVGTAVEFDQRLLDSLPFSERLAPYLHGLEAAPDLRNHSLVIYEGHGGLLALSRSKDPRQHAMYDDFVRVIRP
jgi:hypothetical protein